MTISLLRKNASLRLDRRSSFVAKRVLDSSTSFVDLTPSTGGRKVRVVLSSNKFPPSSDRQNTESKAWHCRVLTASHTGGKGSVFLSPARNPTPLNVPLEITYQVFIQTGSLQQDTIQEETDFYLVIHGKNDQQTRELFLKEAIVGEREKAFKNDEKTEFRFEAIDVGRVSFAAVELTFVFTESLHRSRKSFSDRTSPSMN